jgi:hypothetical protein
MSNNRMLHVIMVCFADHGALRILASRSAKGKRRLGNLVRSRRLRLSAEPDPRTAAGIVGESSTGIEEQTHASIVLGFASMSVLRNESVEPDDWKSLQKRVA